MTGQTLIDQDAISAPLSMWNWFWFCQFDPFQRCSFCKMFPHVTDTPWNHWDALPSTETSAKCGVWQNWIGETECWMILGFWAIHPHKFPLWTDGWTRYGPKPSITAARAQVQIFYLHLCTPLQIGKHLWLNWWKNWVTTLSERVLHSLVTKIELEMQRVGCIWDFWAIHPHKCPLSTDRSIPSRDSNHRLQTVGSKFQF